MKRENSTSLYYFETFCQQSRISTPKIIYIFIFLKFYIFIHKIPDKTRRDLIKIRVISCSWTFILFQVSIQYPQIILIASKRSYCVLDGSKKSKFTLKISHLIDHADIWGNLSQSSHKVFIIHLFLIRH